MYTGLTTRQTILRDVIVVGGVLLIIFLLRSAKEEELQTSTYQPMVYSQMEK